LDFIAIILHCIQCFDAVSWAAGRASGLKKNIAGWWTWALISPDGVAPSQIVSVSASVNFPLHHKVQLLAPAHPGGPGKGAIKRLWCGGGGIMAILLNQLQYMKYTYLFWAFEHC